MSRFLVMPLAAALLTTACKVERTPSEYFDHRTPPAIEREAVAAELQDRLLAMGQALNRGNADEAMIALAPAADAYVLTPADGAVLTGADQIAAVFRSYAGDTLPVAVEEVEVRVGPRETVAWFRAVMSLPGRVAIGEKLHITGVYVRVEGAWQLAQAHLSAPIQPREPQAENPEAAGDSLGAG